MARRLRGTHVTLLEAPGRPVRVRHGGGTIDLIGLPGVHRRDLTPEVLDSLPRRDASPQGPDLRIVLSHFPDHLRRTQEILRPDLFLAGHTHGGQCCLPGRIPILRHDSLPRRLCSGVHRVGDTWLVVCRGIGTTTIPLRVFCPPEVIELRLAKTLA
jgi:predicted MPP superfamily phosphohydrolase